MFERVGFWLLRGQFLNDWRLWIHPFLSNLVEPVESFQNLLDCGLEGLDVLEWAKCRYKEPEDDSCSNRSSQSGDDSAKEDHPPSCVLFDLLSQKLVLFSQEDNEFFMFAGLDGVRHVTFAS